MKTKEVFKKAAEIKRKKSVAWEVALKEAWNLYYESQKSAFEMMEELMFWMIALAGEKIDNDLYSKHEREIKKSWKHRGGSVEAWHNARDRAAIQAGYEVYGW